MASKKPLGILIQAKVNVSDIDNQVKQIQEKLKEIDLKIKIDRDVLDTLKQFNKVVGELDKATIKAMANLSRGGKSISESIKGANVEAKKLINQMGQITNISDNFDGEKNFTGRKIKRRNKNGVVETTLDAEMNPVSYKVVQNIEDIKRKEAEFEHYHKQWVKRIDDAVATGVITDKTANNLKKKLDKLSPTSFKFNIGKKSFEKDFGESENVGKAHAQALKQNAKLDSDKLDALQKQANAENKIFDKRKKGQEDLDKLHYLALREDEARDQKRMDSIQKQAIAENKAFDKRKSDVEKFDKTHYMALREDESRDKKKMDAIQAQANAENKAFDKRRKNQEDMDKLHYLALKENEDRSRKDIDNLHRKANVENKSFNKRKKAEEDMDKLHFMALREDEARDKKKMDDIHKQASADNKAFDKQKKQQEDLDKAHYNALRDDESRDKKKMDEIHKRALSENKEVDRRKKQQEDLDKDHYMALREDEKRDQKKMASIHQEALAQNKLFNQKAKQDEDLEKAHYKALNENAKRDKKIMDDLHKEAMKMNEEVNKQSFLSRKKVADVSGLNYNSDEDVRGKIADELNKKHGLTGKRAIDPNAISVERVWDNKTQQELIRFNALMNDGGKLVTNYKGTIDQLNHSMYQNGSTVKNNTSAQMGFFESLKTAMQKIPVWMAGMTLFYQSLHFFTEGIAYVNDLNKSLTEISIVTGQSQSGVEKLGQEYADLAQEMRVTTLELTKSAVEFYRQGLNHEQVAERLRTTTEYAKISSLDMKEATEILTATINSMGISAERATDVFAYMGDATATGADEIGKAFQKVGGTAGALNIEFEKVASWIAVISSNTRESAENIGNSIKSILARIQNVREKGFDAEDGTDINMISKALSSVGIQLLDATGNFRDFGKVMDELGAKWVTLSSREKAYIATTVAGSYQQSRFLNIMEDYSQTVDLYNESLGAAGTTQQKYNLWLQGTEAHLNALKAAGQNLWQDTFNSQGIRNALDLLTMLVRAIDFLIEKFGAINVLVPVVAYAILKFNDTAKDGKTWLTNMASATRLGTSALLAMEAGFTKLGMSAKAATWAVRAFEATVTLGLTVAITAVVELIAHFAGKSAEAEQRLQDMGRRIEDMTKTYQEHGAEINKLVDTIEKFEKTNPDGKGLSTDKLDEYTKAKEKLVDLMPQFVESIDEEGKKRLVNVDAMNKEIESLERLSKAKQEEKAGAFRENFVKQSEELENARKDFDKSKSSLAEWDAYSEIYNGDSWKDNKSLMEDYTNEQAKSLQIMSQYETVLNQANVDWRDHLRTQAELVNGYKDLSSESKRYFDNVAKKSEFTDAKGDLNEVAKQEQKMRDLVKFAVELENAMKGDDKFQTGNPQWWTQNFGDKAYAEQLTFVNNLKTAAEQAGLPMELFNTLLSKYMGKTMEAGKLTTDFQGVMADLGSDLVDSADKVKDLNKAIEKLNRGQKLTYDEVMSLTKAHPELAKSWKIVNGQIEISKEAFLTERNAALQGTRDKIAAKREELRIGAQALEQQLGFMHQEIQGIKSVAEARLLVNSLMEDAVNSAPDASGSTEGAQAAASMGANSVLEYAQALEYLDEISNKVATGLDFSTSTDDPLSKNSDKVSAFTKAIDELNAKIEESKRKLASYPKASQAYRDALQEQINLLKEKQKLVQAEIDNPTDYTNGVATTAGQTTQTITSSTGVKGLQGVLAGKEGSFVASGQKYNVDPALIAAIAMHESGRGSSQLAKTNNNIAGMTDYTGKFSDGWMHYDSVEASIDDLARQISTYYVKKGLTTIEKIGAQYAPSGADNDPNGLNNNWVSGVKNIYKEVSSGGGTYTVTSGSEGTANESQIYSKQLSLKEDLLKISDDISQIEQDIFNSHLQGWEDSIQELDFTLKKSGIMMGQYQKQLEDSSWTNKDALSSVNAEYNNQIQSLKDKQSLMHQEAEYIRKNGKMTDENIQKIKNLQSQWWDTEQAIYQSTQAQKDFNQEYEKYNKDLAAKELESVENAADKIIETWKEAIEKKKELELKAIEETQKEQEKAHKKRIEELEDEMKKLDEVHDSQVKAIEKETRDDDYNDKLTKAQKELAEIQNQMNILSLDKSVEGRQKMKDLQKQLEDKQKAVDDIIKDKQRDDRKRNLDEEYEANKKINEAEKDKADKKLETQKEANDKAVEDANNTADELLQNDQYWADRRKEIIKGNYDEVTKMLGQYLGDYKTKLETETLELSKIIEKNVIKKLEDAMKLLPSVNGDSRSKRDEDTNDFEVYIRNKLKWLTSGDAERQDLSKENDNLRQQYGYKDYTKEELFNDPQLQWMVEKYRGEAFRDYVQNKVRWILASQKGEKAEMERLATINNRMRDSWGFKDYTLAELQADPELAKLIKPFGFDTGGYTGSWSGNDGKLALLHQKEMVLNEDDTSNMLRVIDMVRGMVGNVNGLNQSQLVLSKQQDPTNVTYNISMRIDKVDGGESGAKDMYSKLVTEIKKKGGAI